MSHLTPDLLLAAADRLIGPGEQAIPHTTSQFMCWCVQFAAGGRETGAKTAQRLEFEALLRLHGVVTFGSVMDPLRPELAVGHPDRYGTDAERQAVRFMFLEFLALSLEDV